MQDREDKIIAKKINGLQTLPEGYSPDLDSKWALLEAGLKREVSGNRPPLIWSGLAASVVGILLLGWVYYFQSQDTGAAQELPAASALQPMVTEENGIWRENENEVENGSSGIITITRLVSHVSVPEISLQTNSAGTPVSAGEQLPPASGTDTGDEESKMNPVSPSTEPLAAVPETGRELRRYVQIDFDDPWPAMTVRRENLTVSGDFRIRVLDRDTESGLAVSNAGNKGTRALFKIDF